MEGCRDRNGKMWCGNSRRKGGGESQRSLGFETVLGFLSKGRDLQDLIDSVNLRTLIPKRF